MSDVNVKTMRAYVGDDKPPLINMCRTNKITRNH